MLKNLRILLADDEYLVRTFTRESLETLSGVSIEEVGEGKQLIELARTRAFEKNPFDFIVSDYNMPNLRGIAAIRELRFDTCPPMNTPALITTGGIEDAQKDGERLIEVSNLNRELYQVDGVSRLYLMKKPFTPQALIENIRYVLDRE